MEGCTGGVRIVSRRLFRPQPPAPLEPETTTMHLTPWDLRMITVEYIQKGLLLPKPRTAGGAAQLVDSLASSLACALARFYPLAGRLAVEETTASSGGPGIIVSLCCNGEGAEFVHAEALEVTVSNIIAPTTGLGGYYYYFPSSVVWFFFPLNGLLGADAALDDGPVLAAQVTELADGVFVTMSLNHAVADGTTFWHLFNTWSEISHRTRSGGDGDGDPVHDELLLSTQRPVLDRWFVDNSAFLKDAILSK